MTQTCAVLNCHSPKNVSYHRFPRDPQIASQWIQACNRGDSVNPKTARICSRHFTSGDYARDLKNELLGLPTKKLLIPAAVPSVGLGLESVPVAVSSSSSPLCQVKEETPEEIEEREDRLKKERSEFVKEILESADSQFYFTDTVFSKRKKRDFIFEEEAPNDKCIQTERFHIFDEADKKVQRLQRQVADLKYAVKMLNKSRARMKSKKYQRSLVKAELLKYYTAAQVNFLLGKKRKSCKWSDEDIRTGLVLRSMISRKAYKFLRDKRLFPVPGLTTIRQRVKKFNPASNKNSDMLSAVVNSLVKDKLNSDNDLEDGSASPGTTVSAYSDGDRDIDDDDDEDEEDLDEDEDLQEVEVEEEPTEYLEAIVTEQPTVILESTDAVDSTEHIINGQHVTIVQEGTYIQHHPQVIHQQHHQQIQIQQPHQQYQHSVVDLNQYLDLNIQVAHQEVATTTEFKK